jgi:hypothetical protein
MSFLFSYSLFFHTLIFLAFLFFFAFHLSMSYDSIVFSISISVSYFLPLSSLHRSTRAQRVSSGLLVYVILFFNRELQ